MRLLKTCLWVVGLGCLLAAPLLVLPWATLRSMAAALGVEQFPEAPALAYALRALLATYVPIGVFFIILARDPLRHAAVIPFAGGSVVFVGVVCGLTGLVLQVPPLWYVFDFLFCLLFGLGILGGWAKARRAGGEAAP